MKTSDYKRQVRATLAPVKLSKSGIRSNMKKKAKVVIGHAMAGVVSEILEFQEEMSPFISGESQLTDALRQKARPEFGDILYYVALAAKELKVKLPTSTKKVKGEGTITEQVLALLPVASDISGLQKKQYYGEEVEYEKVRAAWEELVHALWAACLAVFKEPPAALMAENVEKLKKRYPTGAWTHEGACKNEVAEKAAA